MRTPSARVARPSPTRTGNDTGRRNDVPIGPVGPDTVPLTLPIANTSPFRWTKRCTATVPVNLTPPSPLPARGRTSALDEGGSAATVRGTTNEIVESAIKHRHSFLIFFPLCRSHRSCDESGSTETSEPSPVQGEYLWPVTCAAPE